MFKFQVGFFECENCGSLQTERPYWLEEAYSHSNLAAIDTFAANRVISNAALTWAVSAVFKSRKNLLDYGGGDGLLSRLLRDQGLDAYVFDPYSRASYALSFMGKLEAPYDTVTAFEVLEHLPEPGEFFEKVFSTAQSVVLCTTDLYKQQGPDWHYLAPEAGTHVFFYHERAIQLIAEKQGWKAVIRPRFIVFTRNSPSLMQGLALRLLNGAVVRLIAAFMCVMPRSGHFRDQAIIRKTLADTHGSDVRKQ